MDKPTNTKAPFELELLVDYRYPDALAVDYVRHSDRCFTVTVLDLDYRYCVWRANLSCDSRWTLSPVDVPRDNTLTF